MAEPITPPATIGVLGGGQLGRYLVMAARTMGYRTMVLEPDPAAPAGAVAHEHLIAAYDDPIAVDHLAAHCAVVTTEFENAPASTLVRLAQRVRVAPSPQAVAMAQDRMVEKTFLTSMGCAVGPYRTITSSDDVSAGGDVFPTILKTARLGYDGKGQITVDHGDDLASAWDRLGRVPCVLEERLPLEAELSVVLARNPQGQVAAFAPTQNHHRSGILDLSIAPVTGHLAQQATAQAVRIAEALDYVGVLGVEMFVVNGTLLVNELAPRPHNSGHWTLDGALTSQFEQQVRAICGLALGDTTLTVPAVAMVNLLGDHWVHGVPHWAAALSSPRAHLHLYGKTEPRPGRKMGHLTVTGDAIASTADEANELRRQILSTR